MDQFDNDEVRNHMIMAALSDKNSTYYQGLIKLLQVSEANARKARLVSSSVIVPFPIDDRDLLALEAQFSVVIKTRGGVHRSRLTPRVAAVAHLVDAALLEHAGGNARKVLMIDGDLMTLVASGLQGRIVERTHAHARLDVGYSMEDRMIVNFSNLTDREVNLSASLIRRELIAGGGEHYWPCVREHGPCVDSIVVNHFKTPIGPKQLAFLALRRQAVVYGALPFQVEMLYVDVGRLVAFPGTYYIDRSADVITLVPDAEANMTISFPYSMMLDIIMRNSVTVCGVEFLCEKYKSVPGIMYYSLSGVTSGFEANEVLRTSYFDSSSLGITKISFPRVKMSKEGVPIGWERGEVRILTSRCEQVLARLSISANEIVTPSEAFAALMDHNNTVVASLDTVTVAKRMSVYDEEEVALALALHVNWVRHNSRKTFATLLNAVKLRHNAKDATLMGLAKMALVAWWTAPNVKHVDACGELPTVEIIDWCGNDFGVVMSEAESWIEIVQEVGGAVEREEKQYPWFPVPPKPRSWLDAMLVKAQGAVAAKRAEQVKILKQLPVRTLAPAVVSKVEAVVVDEFEIDRCGDSFQLTDLKKTLKDKMMRETYAASEIVPVNKILTRGLFTTGELTAIPVVDVDPVSAIQSDVLMCNSGPFDRDMVSTGYRLAEVEIDKVFEGSLRVNDSKRNVPKGSWVRRPKVDAGVEGKRVSSQQALLGALFKRNIGVPANRGSVNLDVTPALAVERVIQVCYRDNWQDIVAKHLDTGLWEANGEDIDSYIGNLDEKKVDNLLKEFFSEGSVDLVNWNLMAKGKIKASREASADSKIDHSQTILYLQSGNTNAMYSAMTRRFKNVVDECLRPEVCLNGQRSDEEQEKWYNELESSRRSHTRTYSYSADIKCYDRSQEHVGLKLDLEFYKKHGLSQERLLIWQRTHGVKRANAMMFGIVAFLVLEGVSGLWKTLMRNGIINLAALIVSTGINRADVVMMDIKGDDLDVEFSRPVDVETTVEQLSLTFNFSAKFFTNNVRYMCKAFRLRIMGRWYFVADPWARVQSLCTPLIVGNHNDTLMERWESLRADLRHYDNGILVDAVAEAAMEYYGLPRPLYGFARSLSCLAEDRGKYCNFFYSPERID